MIFIAAVVSAEVSYLHSRLYCCRSDFKRTPSFDDSAFVIDVTRDKYEPSQVVNLVPQL